MNGLRQIVLVVLLIGGIGAVAAQDQDVTDALTQDLVSARIQIFRDAGNQEGAETTVGSYEAVLNWLGEADVHAASESGFVPLPSATSMARNCWFPTRSLLPVAC